jgi:hypothetical protein
MRTRDLFIPKVGMHNDDTPSRYELLVVFEVGKGSTQRFILQSTIYGGMNLARFWGLTRVPKTDGGTIIGKVWGQPKIVRRHIVKNRCHVRTLRGCTEVIPDAELCPGPPVLSR